ncbi:hypothetical protein ACMWP0_02475 [Helicobacter pylori]|uniref:hypothetical protein n=1 Tax=Helicobacter pylori TaxID=210 RepID=UPI0039E10B4A|nr:hypothetical protein [Helicobacter pylori]WQZ28587.1 hypothetical protein E5P99_00135 [Helicobacter pylori]
MLFLRFPLLASCHAPYLPHILKLWRMIQSCNKHALKLLQATPSHHPIKTLLVLK